MPHPLATPSEARHATANPIARSRRWLLVGAAGVLLGTGIGHGAPGPEDLHPYAMLVFTRPKPAQADAFNAWYDRQHLPDMLKVPGIVSAARFLTSRADTPESTLPPYLAWYELRAPSPDAFNAEIGRRFRAGLIQRSDALDYSSVVTALFEPLGARQIAAATASAAATPKSMIYELLAFTSPIPGREAEFNAWYEHQHLPDVLRNPGFHWAQRYRLKQVLDPGVAIPEYLARFEFESTDLTASIEEILRRIRSGETRMTDSMARQSMVYYVQPVGPSRAASIVDASHP